MLHGVDSWVIPTHCKPPCAGAGFVQVRLLLLSPPPHDLLHALARVHSEKPPSTKRQDMIQLLYVATVDAMAPSEMAVRRKPAGIPLQFFNTASSLPRILGTSIEK